MKLVVGLGNPGEKYENNRHNIGRKVVDRIFNFQFSIFKEGPSQNFQWGDKFGAETVKFGEVVLAKAGEGKFMNESGKWVGRLKNFYKIENKDMIVIYDDLDLEMGRVLVSDRGPKIHNGVNSVTRAIGEGFIHVRCGVDDRGGDRSVPGEAFVLQDFPDGKTRDATVERAIEEIEKMYMVPR